LLELELVDLYIEDNDENEELDDELEEEYESIELDESEKLDPLEDE
jgi:hypothetical protein